MKFIKSIKRTLPFIAIGILVASCGSKKKEGGNTGTMVCVKSFENVMRQEIIVYENVYPKAVIGCQYVTEGEAIERLKSGNTKLAVIGRELTENEHAILKKQYPRMRSMQIAVDAVALIVNPDNPVDEVTMEDITKILNGDIKTWNQLKPGAPNKPIRVVVDNPQSGLPTYIRDKFLNGKPFNEKTVVTADSLSGVFDKVKSNVADLGVIGVSWLATDMGKMDVDTLMSTINDDKPIDGMAINAKVANSGVKTLGIMCVTDGLKPFEVYKPTQENIYEGNYPLTRPIYMVTTASPVGTLGKFYTYVTGVNGQKIIMKTGAVMPKRKQPNIYEISN